MIGAAFAELLAERLPQRRQPAEVRRRRAAAALRRARATSSARRARRVRHAAARCARSARSQTSAGKVTLRMSQGMHSGDVHSLRSSAPSHRELIVAGPAATAVVAHGEASPARARSRSQPRPPRALPDGWLRRQARRRLRCSPPRREGREPGPPSCRAAADRRGGAAACPREVRAHVAGGQPQPEHRDRDGRLPALRRHRRADRGARASRRPRDAIDELVTDVQARRRRASRSASCSPTSTRTAAS